MRLGDHARVVGWCVLWMVACEDGPPPSGMDAPEESIGAASAAGAECKAEHASEACTCPDGAAATRTCMAQRWQPCACSAPPIAAEAGARADAGDVMADAGEMQEPVPDPFAGNARSDIVFDWTRSEPDPRACEPGHYEGSFAGLYYSRINWPVPFPVAGIDLPDRPGLQFELKPAGAGETVLAVDGRFDGLADGVFPFRGQFVGELDCTTGKFSGKMINADYSIGPRDLVVVENPVWFAFEGPVQADYDKVTHTFVNGLWDAVEPEFGGKPAAELPRDPLRDGVGGSGVWSTGWIGPPVEYKCPDFTAEGLPLACEPGPFGLNKPFCVYPALLPGFRADAPTCESDAQCELHFPGAGVKCVDINGDGAMVRCLKECSP